MVGWAGRHHAERAAVPAHGDPARRPLAAGPRGQGLACAGPAGLGPVSRGPPAGRYRADGRRERGGLEVASGVTRRRERGGAGRSQRQAAVRAGGEGGLGAGMRARAGPGQTGK